MTERDQKIVVLVILGCVGIVGLGAVIGYLLGLVFDSPFR
jgi:NhaP-type Na+/H+ or K+/H+ antiporter